MIHWHKWTKWETIEKGQIEMGSLINPEHKYVNGNYLIQEKECTICGKKKLRTVKTKL